MTSTLSPQEAAAVARHVLREYESARRAGVELSNRRVRSMAVAMSNVVDQLDRTLLALDAERQRNVILSSSLDRLNERLDDVSHKLRELGSLPHI